MTKLIAFFTLLLFCSVCNAAYYFNLDTSKKMTVTNDMKKAVIVESGKKPIRLKLFDSYTNEVDDFGRPYSASNYIGESCEKAWECDVYPVVIKVYTDKTGGMIVFAIDSKNKKIVWSSTITEKDINKDDG